MRITRDQVIAALVRLYPAAWRREYGDELIGVLAARPLTLRVVLDVAASAARERARAPEPATILGIASMLVVCAGFVLTPGRYGVNWPAVVRPTGITFPTVTVTVVASDVYAVLLIACGCWTRLRGGAAARPGIAAMKTSLIAGLPVVAAGLLMTVGAIDVTFVPGAQAIDPAPIVMTIAPLLRLPESWIWGSVGGSLARWIEGVRRTETTR